MNNVRKIVDLAVDRLVPHPNNPRKDLGDLTELADSIKKNGIMQNLTVVDNGNGEYTVIIGHRRCAAAKLAGAKTVPCAIVEMSEKEQLATMLAENMQRADLTIIEQAEGIQLMLDLGESVSDIAEQTGLSESTVRRRKRLMEFDRDELKAAEQRGATLADYAKLDEIEPQYRDEALKAIGTNNFDWKIKQINDRSRRKQRMDECERIVSEFAELIDCDDVDYSIHSYYSSFGGYSDKYIKKPDNTDSVKYVYYYSGKNTDYPNIKVFTVKSDEEIKEKNAADEKQAELNQRKSDWRDRAESIDKQMYCMRSEFINNLKAIAKEQKDSVIKQLIDNIFTYDLYCVDYEDLTDITGLIFDEDEGFLVNLDELTRNSAETEALCAKLAYFIFEDSKEQSYVEKYYQARGNTRNINPKLNAIYNYLTMLGYVMSDEEKQLRDGTHPIFEEYPRE